MSRFLETICIRHGEAQRLPWHQRRVDRTLTAHYTDATLDLGAILDAADVPPQELIKCRIAYDDHQYQVQMVPYVARPVNTLKLVEVPVIDYPFKLVDRIAIERAFAQRKECDDVLIVRNGLVTDSSIANIIFRQGTRWLTPRRPLLQGTMRAFLLDHDLIHESDIPLRDVAKFDRFKLINSMLAFDSPEHDISGIHF